MKLAIVMAACLLLIATLSFAEPAHSVAHIGEPLRIRQVGQTGGTSLYILGEQGALEILFVASGNDSIFEHSPAVPARH